MIRWVLGHWLPDRSDAMWWLLVSNFIMVAAITAVQPIVPLYVRALGGGATEVALFVALPAVLNTAAQLPTGWLLGRVGRLPLLLGSRAVHALAAAALFLLKGPLWLLLGLRSAQGAAAGVYYPTLRTVVADATAVEHRGTRFAQLEATAMAGVFLGPLIGGTVAAVAGPSAVFGLAAVGTVAVIGGLRKVPETKSAPENRKSPRNGGPLSVTRNGLVPLLALLASGVNAGMGAVVWPQYILSRGFGAFIVGLSYALFAFPAIFLAKPIGRLADRADRRLILVIALAVALTSNLLYPAIHTLWQIFALTLIDAAAAACVSPVAYAALSESVPPEFRGRAMSTGGFVQSAGTVAGSVVLGSAYGPNPSLPFFGAAGVQMAVAILVATMLAARRPGRGLGAQRFMESMEGALQGHDISLEHLERLASELRGAPASPALHFYLNALDVAIDAASTSPQIGDGLGPHRDDLNSAWLYYEYERWRNQARTSAGPIVE